MPAKKNNRKKNKNRNRVLVNKPLEKKRTTAERILEPIDSDKFFARNLWFFVAFAVPFFAMLFCFALMKVSPFGDQQILATDSWHQYYPFMADFQDNLQSGGSLLWSWSSGGGVNYLGLMSYYLASPLNFLSILVPAENLTEFFMFITCAKVGFASLFFAHFLRITFNKRDVSVTAFGIMYGLSAFMAGYYWNIIWLDSIALLPLVVAGAVSVLRDGKFRLYVIALALAILSNYYIGLFVCVFIVFVSIIYCIVEFSTIKDLFMQFVKMVGYSTLGISITAILSLPALLALMSTQSSVEPGSTYSNTPPVGMQLYFTQVADPDSFTEVIKGIMSAFKYTLANTVNFADPNVKNMQLPNIYCGVAMLILAIMYFTCSKIKVREKIAAGVLCLVFYLSFTIKWLDFMWHGFHFPNMLEYRYAFLFSFVILTMAYRLYMNMDSIKLVNVAVTVVMAFIMFTIIVDQIRINLEKDTEYSGANKAEHLDKLSDIIIYGSILITFLVLMWVLMYALEVVPKNALAVALVIICVAEGFCSVYFGTHKVGTTPTDSYPLGTTDTLNVVDKIDELEEHNVDLARAEVTKNHTLNDNALIGINGISMFSSMVNSKVTEYMKTIGLSAYVPSSRFTYQESSPVTNLFLNLKYLVSVKGKHLDKMHTTEVYSSSQKNTIEPIKLLRNEYYVPMGFVVNKDMLKYSVDNASSNPFVNQNRLFSNAYGTVENVYELLPSTTNSAGVTKSTEGYYRFTKDATEINCDYVATKTGTACAFFQCGESDNVTLKINGNVVNTNYAKYPYIMMVGDVKQGDTISISAQLTNVQSYGGSAEIHCAMLNEELFRAGYSKFKKASLNATKITDTCIEGTVNTMNEGLFYTSISYDKGWKAYVDGEQVEITPVADAQVAFLVPRGYHEIELKYTPPGFVAGTIVTVLGLLIFAAIILWTTKREWVMKMIKKEPQQAIEEKTVSANNDTE